MTTGENSAAPEWQHRVWIGLVSLLSSGRFIDDGATIPKGAEVFSNFVASATNALEFSQALVDQAGANGLEVQEIVWTESLASRLAKFEIDDYLLKLARGIDRGRTLGSFGTLHFWDPSETD